MAVKTVQAIINGQTYTLTKNSETGKYEATITAPSKSSYSQEGHYYNVTVKATDVAGNTTTKDASDSALGSKLQLRVKEKVAPVISITYPSASAFITNNKPTIKWSVADNDSGVNSNTISIKIDGGNVITEGIVKTATNSGYECSYTPSSVLSDGSHTVTINASDNDGNAASAKTVTFKIDTVPPVLTISNPSEGLVTNNTSLTVKGTTSDATSSPVTLTIKLNSGAAEAVTVNSDGSFSKVLTLTNGTNTITVVAKDSAGKTSTITRTVTLDTVAPIFGAITLTPNPVDAGKTFVISVEVSD